MKMLMCQKVKKSIDKQVRRVGGIDGMPPLLKFN